MQALARAGFVVDYIEGAKEMTWDKVKSYNVLVVYDFPARDANAEPGVTSFFMHAAVAGGLLGGAGQVPQGGGRGVPTLLPLLRRGRA